MGCGWHGGNAPALESATELTGVRPGKALNLFPLHDLRCPDPSAQLPVHLATWPACSVASEPRTPPCTSLRLWAPRACTPWSHAEDLGNPARPPSLLPPGTTAPEHALGPQEDLGPPLPTHNEDGHEAGQRGVPVPAARGRRLAHQHAVEDEVSEAQLHPPCVGETESIIPGGGSSQTPGAQRRAWGAQGAGGVALPPGPARLASGARTGCLGKP